MLGYLIEELLVLCEKDKSNHLKKEKLQELQEQCISFENEKRPLFKDVLINLNLST